MTPERRETARRFAAAPKWAWLPGMAYVSTKRGDKMRRGRLGLAPQGGDCFRCVEDWYHGDEFECRDPDDFAKWKWLPDLDDDLTRLGVLAVVRRAWGDDEFCTACMPDGEWKADGQFVIFSGPTEESAMLAALEAAPK